MICDVLRSEMHKPRRGLAGGGLILAYMRMHQKCCGLMFMLILLASGTALLAPLVLGRFVDMLASGQTMVWLGIAYLGISMLAGIAESAQNSGIIALGQQLMHFLRTKLAAKLTRLPSMYYVSHPAGETSSRLLNDVDAVNVLFTEGIVTLFATSLQIVATLAIIFWTNAALGCFITVVLPLLWIFTRACQRRVRAAQLAQRSAVADVFAWLPETIRNLPIIRNLGAEAFMTVRYDETIGRSFRATAKTNFFDSVYSPVIKSVTAAVIASMMVLAAGESTRAFFHLSVGQAVAMMSYILTLFAPLEALGMEIQSIQTAAAALERVQDFLDLPENVPLPDTAAEARDRSIDTPVCAFRDVTFGYDASKPVLHQLGFEVRTGERVVLRGRTGAGKTTIFRLLTGLCEPDCGEVLLFGQPVSAIQPEARRRLFGVVEQAFEPVLGTVRDQITLRQGENRADDASSTDENVWKSLKQAGLDEPVRALPKGLDTPMGEAGFSQGQLQLLALARALLYEPPLLLLDEFTAHLDAQTETEILSALARAAEGRTILSISHRMAALPGVRYLDL